MGAGPLISSSWSLTGKMRVRRTWRGKLIIELQESQWVGSAQPGQEHGPHNRFRWRDAADQDFYLVSTCLEEKVRLRVQASSRGAQ